MRRDLLPLLRCPSCGSGLTLDAPDRDLIDAGTLSCRCGGRYPVTRGIPRFVPGETYAASFGAQWRQFNRTQLDGAGQAFVEKTGIAPESLRGRLVLDAGCGVGRFADVCTRAGATVVAVDLSTAVEAAAANLAGSPCTHVLQADILSLPLAPGAFDLVYSLGVLHHTPDTRASFLALPRFLRPGGTLVVWVYGRGVEGEAASDRIRRVTSRLPAPVLLALCQAAACFYPLHRRPRLGALARRFLPICLDPSYEARVLGTFDWYAPRFQWKHTPEEVVEWFREAGLTQIHLLPVPVAVRGEAPAAAEAA